MTGRGPRGLQRRTNIGPGEAQGAASAGVIASGAAPTALSVDSRIVLLDLEFGDVYLTLPPIPSSGALHFVLRTFRGTGSATYVRVTLAGSDILFIGGTSFPVTTDPGGLESATSFDLIGISGVWFVSNVTAPA